ncbi:GGDEF domain-containing response regulator [Phosphitispora fastidiosa]|uniref:GGDEF domain-containing response regulator n=1 Tax=Phosphitispora fastidiosa TaxID=2837202 RepID=UPI001E59C056|nr:diguanylate cyclase [Phosphitispora fastidiosa]MBU7006653.1 diguanylate cyclase (GGDEF)-like protein [Phosphitispora fastidiosa]
MLEPVTIRDNAKKIMVIEDNCITLCQLRDYLGEQGYSIIPCKRCDDAMTLLEEVTPDLIILDIIMPDVDGYELCKWLKSHSRLKMIPIVFLTAKTSLEDKLEGFQTGGDDYITKPFAEEELLARIQAILNRINSYYSISMRDELTGAYNRRYLKERMDEEFYRVRRTGRPFSIVVLDIDFFKNINDIYGHYAGDSVLVEFVRFLQTRLRKSDLIARLGGDEFLVLLPDTTSGRAYFLVERLRQSLEEIRFYHKKDGIATENQVTISAGIACCPEHGDTEEILFTLADVALYNAKKSGRNATKIAEGANEGIACK